jgi:DNA mismatch repair protein MutS
VAVRSPLGTTAGRPVAGGGYTPLSMSSVARLTPMLRHYLEVKGEYPDCILLYRMGDFYEMFFEDAQRAAPILEVALTARQKGTDSEAPMCGVPHHALDTYVGKLLRAGLKVAICNQVEDPAEAKGLVRREVTRVMTPGTLSEPSLLDGKEANLLAAVSWSGESGAVAFLDVSTGSYAAQRFESVEEAVEALGLEAPREVLLLDDLPAAIEQWAETSVLCVTPVTDDRWFDRGRSADVLRRQFDVGTLRGFGLEDGEPAVEAAAAVLAYARETQQSDLSHVRGLTLRLGASAMMLDAATLRNLEIFHPAQNEARGPTLLRTLDATQTAQGGRLLRDWLRRPLVDVTAIRRRLDAVEALVADAACRTRLRELLAEAGDPERLLSRAVIGTLSPREAAALRDVLDLTPQILSLMSASASDLLHELSVTDPAETLRDELHRVLAAEPAARLQAGGVIADGVDSELDRCRSLARDSKQHILQLQAEEREATGISSLKIRFNKVFNYYIEVTKANLEAVPERYERKQTLANSERFITPELKALEEQILSAEQRQLELEEAHFVALRETVAGDGERLRRIGAALAVLDVLSTFAQLAVDRSYSRPTLGAGGEAIEIRAGRHPVVERSGIESFVPNDCQLDGESAQIVVLTGPNMGGKSTYLRQVALIVLLAQIGSFVPAESAAIGVVDRLFTRVGASDNLAQGESTFMVEMIETANILHNATGRSLVVLDEIGRGTATFDGLSLAWAIVEYLHEHQRPKTLFATHYHELTELAGLLPRVINRTMAVKEWGDKIVFLRQVVPGSADKSYGLHVARLAGVPDEVVSRAEEVLANMEEKEFDAAGTPRLAHGSLPEDRRAPQMPLFTPPEEVVARVIGELDVDQLTPVAALNLLVSLKSRLKGDE